MDKWSVRVEFEVEAESAELAKNIVEIGIGDQGVLELPVTWYPVLMKRRPGS